MRWIACLLAIAAALAQDAPPPAGVPAPAPVADVPSADVSADVSAGTPPAGAPKDVEVGGREFWIDSGVDLRAGDEITLTATGALELSGGRTVNAAGAARGWRDLLRSYPVNAAGQGALIGRVGESSQPFLVGAKSTYAAPRAGRLYLSVNKAGNDAPGGSFHVAIAFTARAPKAASAPASNATLVRIDTAVVDRFPRRVVDAQGNDGDNTNFVMVGSEQTVLGALAAAGWVEVDRSKQAAVLSGILAVLNKDAYLTLPMSELTLFDRPQDHGMAHAEPIAVVAERHHFRIWKAPFEVGGRTIWVGAGTHDIGFDRDARNNGVTHKIDPDVDRERDFIGQSLEETGQVLKLEYVTPSKPSTEAVTATGATFHSDGRLLVIHLEAATEAQEPAPAEHIPDAAEESIFAPVVR